MVGPDRRDDEPPDELLVLGLAGFLLVIMGALASGRVLATAGLALTLFAAAFFLQQLLDRWWRDA